MKFYEGMEIIEVLRCIDTPMKILLTVLLVYAMYLIVFEFLISSFDSRRTDRLMFRIEIASYVIAVILWIAFMLCIAMYQPTYECRAIIDFDALDQVWFNATTEIKELLPDGTYRVHIRPLDNLELFRGYEIPFSK